jgi:hypothetical protein
MDGRLDAEGRSLIQNCRLRHVEPEMNHLKIFVKLLGKGTDAWRATNGKPLGNNVFEVLGIARPGEIWEFAPGTRVRCEPRVFSDGSKALVAARADI